MRRLKKPEIDFRTVLFKCLEGVGDSDLRRKYTESLLLLDTDLIERVFTKCAEQSVLYKLPNASTYCGNDFVFRGLTKEDAVNLYSRYLVFKKKLARGIYDEIKVSGGAKCALCGDVGHVNTLDHYLPKSIFPWYSVMPGNLVPCCRDCNTKKGNTLVTKREEQTLHPYFDDEKFFAEQWLAARVLKGSTLTLSYYVSPPITWSVLEKKRVEVHFRRYGLADVFAKEAAAYLPEVIAIRKNWFKNVDSQTFSKSLREMSDSDCLSVNHWRRVMFATLAEDTWFCSNSLNLYI